MTQLRGIDSNTHVCTDPSLTTVLTASSLSANLACSQLLVYEPGIGQILGTCWILKLAPQAQ